MVLNTMAKKLMIGFHTANLYRQQTMQFTKVVTMSNMKCPFCQQELVGTIGHPICRNQNCVMCDDPMPQDLLEELIRTRKALETALDWLGQVATPEKCDDDLCREFTKRKLAEIKTALEQKDVK